MSKTFNFDLKKVAAVAVAPVYAEAADRAEDSRIASALRSGGFWAAIAAFLGCFSHSRPACFR
jgi:hypothetical protein